MPGYVDFVKRRVSDSEARVFTDDPDFRFERSSYGACSTEPKDEGKGGRLFVGPPAGESASDRVRLVVTDLSEPDAFDGFTFDA